MIETYSNLYEILERGRNITDYYIEKNGVWDPSWALLHIHSEVSEVYEAIRKQERRSKIKEEIGDIFLTTLEVCHILGLSDKEIHDLIFDALHKVERRIK